MTNEPMNVVRAQEEKASNKIPAVGIDFGTTNSCVSIVNEGVKANVIPVDGRQTLPSVAAWMGGSRNNWIVGMEAYEQKYNTDFVVYSPKSKIGEDYTYKLTAPNGDKAEFTAEEVASQIMRRLMTEVNKDYKEVTEAVISVPADFSNKKIIATQEAAKLAGIKCIGIIKEPTAAALSSLVGYEKECIVLVFDFGGGTFDVSVVRVKPGTKYSKRFIDLCKNVYDYEIDEKSSSDTVIDVIAQGGDIRLGGDDLDIALTDLILQEVGVKPEELTIKCYEEMKLFTEGLKKREFKGSFNKTLVFKNGDEKEYGMYFNYGMLKKGTEIFYSRCKEIVDSVLAQPAMLGIDIDKILLVGGSTKNRYIKEFLSRDYNLPVDNNINPDEAVSLGASVVAKIRKFGDLGTSLFDITSAAIGVEADGEVDVILKRGTRIPSSYVKRYFLEDVGNGNLVLDIYEGNFKDPKKCSLLSSFSMQLDINEVKKGTEVLISMRVTTDALLEVEVTVNGKTAKKEYSLDTKKAKKSIYDTMRDKVKSSVIESEQNRLLEMISKAESGDKKILAQVGRLIKKYSTENKRKSRDYTIEEVSFDESIYKNKDEE